MIGKLHVLCVVLPVLTISQTQATVAPAGLCDPRITDKPVDLTKLALLGRWITLYGPNIEFIRLLDDITEIITAHENKTFTSVATYVSKDNKTRTSGSYTLTYNNGTVYETYKDDKGKIHQFLVYLLGISEKQKAYLLYRCSHEGKLSVDTRYIAISEGITISDEELKKLLSKDKLQGFKGELYNLPNKYI